ncbi:Tyrosine-protein kinase [Trema orientale]|uniref:Tyrosine-protein kinase n=1 Tax=Trema orientale TaxID=63057 RepID=A0A2P5FAQ2_TREOI|nr:Tyrosine-protein kinase [Trema orientale]
MPKRFFRRPFPPLSPTKHIKAMLMWRHGSVKPNKTARYYKGSHAKTWLSEKKDERLNDIDGCVYYIAPDVHKAYSTEADVWSISVIAYSLSCDSRPFLAKIDPGIFCSVLKADPSFEEEPGPSLSSEEKDFVKCLLIKDPRKRTHDSLYAFIVSPESCFHDALSKTSTVDELRYIKEQFALLEPNKNGTISLKNIKVVGFLHNNVLVFNRNLALVRNATDAIKDSHVPDVLAWFNALQCRRMDFEEFCMAILSVHQLKALDRWEQHARCACELFKKEGNMAMSLKS